jgi:hypothetical protein
MSDFVHEILFSGSSGGNGSSSNKRNMRESEYRHLYEFGKRWNYEDIREFREECV